MTYRDRLAIHLGPLPLRIVLGLTFIWVGLGKINARQEVSGQDAADLMHLGALSGMVAPPPSPAPPTAPPTLDPPAPTPPATQPPAAPPPASPASPKGGDPVEKGDAGKRPPQGKTPPPTAMLNASRDGFIVLASMQPTNTKSGVTATDFPKDKPLLARRLHTSIALTLYRAANPPAATDGAAPAPRSFWFKKLGSGSWPIYLAWTVTLTELIGGVMILFGLGTRLAAIALSCVMLGAIWLTQLGPAWASGYSTLGILPAHDAYDVRMWMPFAWQLALLGGMVALMLSGAGSLSLDRWLSASPDPEEIDA